MQALSSSFSVSWSSSPSHVASGELIRPLCLHLLTYIHGNRDNTYFSGSLEHDTSCCMSSALHNAQPSQQAPLSLVMAEVFDPFDHPVRRGCLTGEAFNKEAENLMTQTPPLSSPTHHFAPTLPTALHPTSSFVPTETEPFPKQWDPDNHQLPKRSEHLTEVDCMTLQSFPPANCLMG